MNCGRCNWPLTDGERRCSNCRAIDAFKLAARIVGKAIMLQPNTVARFALLRRFFGVAVNTWEQMRLFGDAPSVSNPSRLLP